MARHVEQAELLAEAVASGVGAKEGLPREAVLRDHEARHRRAVLGRQAGVAVGFDVVADHGSAAMRTLEVHGGLLDACWPVDAHDVEAVPDGAKLEAASAAADLDGAEFSACLLPDDAGNACAARREELQVLGDHHVLRVAAGPHPHGAAHTNCANARADGGEGLRLATVAARRGTGVNPHVGLSEGGGRLPLVTGRVEGQGLQAAERSFLEGHAERVEAKRELEVRHGGALLGRVGGGEELGAVPHLHLGDAVVGVLGRA